jgi:hypothetical protein
MLGLVFMSVPMPAQAQTLNEWDSGFDHQNHTLNIVKVISGGNATPDDFTVTVSHHNFFFPFIQGSDEYTFDGTGHIAITPQVFHRYSVVENNPGPD